MRPDMHEVVIERPRGGWRMKIGPRPYRWRHDDDELSPRRWACRGNGTKGFSDLLGPLRRFLRGAAGRPWDDVYAELRAGIPARSLIHLHVLQHVGQLVTLAHELDPARPGHTRTGWRINGAYVCPDTGVLRWAGITYRDVRDRDGWVHIRTFLRRRVGRRWAEVLAEAEHLWGRKKDVERRLGGPDGPRLGLFEVVEGVLRLRRR